MIVSTPQDVGLGGNEMRIFSLGLMATSLLSVMPPAAAQETGPAPVPAASPGEAQRLQTEGGTAFTLAPTWQRSDGNAIVTLRPADGSDYRFAIADVAAADAEAAMAEAWRRLDPAFARTILVTAERAPTEGYDAAWSSIYSTSPNERRSVVAFASQKGERWSVWLIDASDADFERNLGAHVALVESIRPAGFVPENLAGRPARPFDAARVEELRSFFATAMGQLGIPGLSFAVVNRDGVIAEGGLGVRALGSAEPVDADSLYMVASNTKSLTTLVFAQLVDEGRVRWDQPVTELYPSFRLGSDEATRAVTVRHLICACTGLPRRDLDWSLTANLDTPASVTFDQLSRITPTSGFGAQYQYSNHLAAAAGFIAGHIVHPEMELGAAYDRTIQERVLAPLGMTRSTFDFRQAMTGNWAQPHSENLQGSPALADNGFNDSVHFMRPTGGLWSSARDMGRYVQNELRLGVLPDGRRMVSAENLLMRRARGVQTGETSWYGLGLEAELFSGIDLIHHGGSMLGYKSDIVILPDAGIGAVLLTNSESGGALLRPFLRRMVELLYDGEPRAAREVRFAAQRRAAGLRAEVARLDPTPDASTAARLAARYTSPDLGFIAVTQNAQGIFFDFGAFGSHVTTRRNEDGTIAFVTTDPGLVGFEFTVRPGTGAHDALVVREAQHEYVYEPAG